MKRVGFIGVGKMGISHLAIANALPGLDVVAISERSLPLRRALEKNGSFACYTDYARMLAKERLDGVIIAVPNDRHFSVVKDCLETNVNIFIEKPLTLKFTESKQLRDLADDKEVFGQVGYVNRFNSVFQWLNSVIASGKLGRVLSYECRMTGSVVVKPNASGWRNDYASGGGCLFDYGPHCIDLAHYLFGAASKVEYATRQKIFSSNVDDAVFAALIHENGTLGRISVNWSDTTVRKATNTVEAHFETGKLHANKQEARIFLNDNIPEFGLVSGWNVRYSTDFDTQVEYYLRGEDFTRQLSEFEAKLIDPTAPLRSDLRSACEVDRVIDEILNVSEGLV